MENDNGRLYYGTGLDNSQLKNDAEQAKNILTGIGSTAEQEGDKIDASMRKIGASIAGVFAIEKIKDFAVQVATVRGQFQQLEASFKTLTGSEQVATDLMSQLINTAATTPFQVTDISNAARQLLAYGVEADKVNETLIRLGGHLRWTFNPDRRPRIPVWHDDDAGAVIYSRPKPVLRPRHSVGRRTGKAVRSCKRGNPKNGRRGKGRLPRS